MNELCISYDRFYGSDIDYESRNFRTQRNRLDKPSLIDTDSWVYFKRRGYTHRHLQRLPSVFTPTTLMWYKNNKNHCIPGPARVYTSGSVIYFLDGGVLSKEEWEVQRLEFLNKGRR